MNPAVRGGFVPVRPARAWPVYCIEAVGSMGGTLFTIGITFYTTSRFNWGPAENFRLAACQGVIYVIGALMAHGFATRFSHRVAVGLLHAMMGLACSAGVLAGWLTSAAGVVSVLMLYTLLSAGCWPILESLAVLGTRGKMLARRLATYNIVWPVVGAIAQAVSGWVIDAIPIGFFLFPAVGHLLAIWFAVKAGNRKQWRSQLDGDSETRSDDASAEIVQTEPHHAAVDPELLKLRTVALWVSRLGLPATYAVIYGLIPFMPTLPAMMRLTPTMQTVVSSAWLAARWLTFVALAAHPWWHTRPRAMVVAAVLMLVAFLGINFAPSQLFGGDVRPAVDLAALFLWQTVLGASLGVIYSGSLYFGMVLSEGSTEHSGYHEALIGLGWVIGPAAGAIMLAIVPNDTRWAVAAVGSVIGISVMCVIVASILGRKR